MHNRLTGALVAVTTAVLLSLAVTWTPSTGAADPPAPKDSPSAKEQPPQNKSDRAALLREFMRKKLAASNKILEGLVIDDARLVREGAEILNEMTEAEKWRVSNDMMYRQFSGEFHRITGELAEAAQKGNLDKATLRWMDATMSCIECHRFVRGMLVTDSAKGGLDDAVAPLGLDDAVAPPVR